METGVNGQVIDLFTHPLSDKTLSRRVRALCQAKPRAGCLAIEIAAAGPRLPEPWLQTLTVTISDPQSGRELTAKVAELVKAEAGYHLVRTEPIEPGAAAEIGQSPSAVIRLSASSGPVLEQSLRSLIAASSRRT